MRRALQWLLLVLLSTLAACSHHAPAPAPAPAATPASERWLKGQTHVHSASSGDSATPPADVARWYAAHGYDFIVFTDHNAITDVAAAAADAGGLLVLPGVELTQNLRT